MNEQSLEAAFRQWWQDSYGRPPGVHAVLTHVGFGAHLLSQLELLGPPARTSPPPSSSSSESSCPC